MPEPEPRSPRSPLLSAPGDAPPAPDPDQMGNRAPKRRAAAAAPTPPHPFAATPAHSPALPPLKAAAPLPPHPPPAPAHASFLDRPLRRRRLFVYIAAFATMLALSSMLDLRRAALNARRAEKVHLALPSAAAPALEEDPATSTPADGAAVAHAAAAAAAAAAVSRHTPPAHPAKPQPARPAAAAAATANQPPQQHPPAAPAAAQDAAAARVSAQSAQLSAQELKDDVDQLIEHVDAESAAAANTTAPAGGAARSGGSGRGAGASGGAGDALAAGAEGSGGGRRGGSGAAGIGAAAAGAAAGDAAPPGAPGAPAANATSEELFTAAQAGVAALARNETTRAFVDANELRTLHALALQGARGDCVQATDPRGGGALFKTDAEAAASDVEKTDPLWGAWCLFSSWYRSDAVREYVLRARALRKRAEAAAAAAAAAAANAAPGAPMPAPPPPPAFDQAAASLDDVLGPEAQARLRSNVELVLPHLHEGDVRYLAALSLQAAFGDCAPYAAAPAAPAPAAAAADGAEEEAPRLRPLTEPLLGQTAVRGEGALWGAWCVFMRRKRAAAAAQLTRRIDLLLEQLSQKLAPDAAAAAAAAAAHAPAAPALPAAARSLAGPL